jgi:lysine 6-dehydrogenase
LYCVNRVFSAPNPLNVNGVMIRPVDLTARLLFPMWQLKEGEVDITIMKIVVEGEKTGQQIRYHLGS